MTYRIIVKGKVQGVGFRYRTKLLADELEVIGYVRNLPDGTVEIVASGEQLESFIEMVKKGYPFARVDEVSIVPYQEINVNDFQITY